MCRSGWSSTCHKKEPDLTQPRAQTYAEVLRQGQHQKQNIGRTDTQAAPAGQRKIEAWVTRTKAPPDSKNTKEKHDSRRTQGTQTKHKTTATQQKTMGKTTHDRPEPAVDVTASGGVGNNMQVGTLIGTLPEPRKGEQEPVEVKIGGKGTITGQTLEGPTWPTSTIQQPTPPDQPRVVAGGNPSGDRKQEVEDSSMWKLYLQNVRGLTADNTVAELAEIIQQNSPDVIMLTETQLKDMTKGRGAKIHSQILNNDYVVYQSPASEKTRGQGVMVAIHKQIATLVTVIDVHTPEKLQGVMKQVILNRKGWTPVAMTAVYIPCGLTKKELGDLYTEVKTYGLDTGQDMIQLMGGDWNAEPQGMKQDNKKHNTKDRALQKFTRAASMTAIPRNDAHKHTPTFRDTSFIDNFYIRTPASNCGDTLTLKGDAKVVEIWGDNTKYTHTDHNALIARVSLTEHGLRKPTQMQAVPPSKERRLVLPLSKEEENALRNRTRTELREEILDIQLQAKSIREGALRQYEEGTLTKHEIDQDRVQHTGKIDELAEKITNLLQSMMDIAHKVGRTKMATADTTHRRPRVTNRKRNNLVRCKKQLSYMKNRLQARSTNTDRTTDDNPLITSQGAAGRPELPEGQSAASKAIEEMCEEEITDDEILDYIDRISGMEASARRQIASIDRTHATLGKQRRTDQHNNILETNQKLGNKLVMQPRDLNTI